MMLQRLCELAQSIEGLPPSMYSSLAFRWQVEIDSGGAFKGVTRLSDGSKKNLGLKLMSPYRKG